METNPDPKTINSETNNTIPQNAILVIEGVKIHPLKDAVINIGRSFENHILIDDPRISRHHAQLRAVNGHYILFDLESTGGTFVNGQRTSQIMLYPGDVISLAGINLTYVQNDPTPHPDRMDTSPLGLSESSRATPTMEKSTIDSKLSDLKSQKPGDAAKDENP